LNGLLTVEVRVLNYYGELMECIDGYIESILVVITSEAGVRISGRPLESVIGGIATFTGLGFAPDTSTSISGLPTLSRSQTSLSIVSRPSLQYDITAPLKLTDVVLSGDTIVTGYSGGSVVLALLVAVVGCWTSVIFIEEAVFCMQGKRKSHMPYTAVASVALGLCGVWGAYVMELGALNFPNAAVSMELAPGTVLGTAPLAIFVVWIAVELYVREFGRRAPRIQRTPRAEFTYGGVNDAQSKADSHDRNQVAPEVQSLVVHSSEGAMPLPVGPGKSTSGTPKASGNSGGNTGTSSKAAKYTKAKVAKVYSAPVRLLRDALMPRVIIANAVLAVLQVCVTILLVTSIRWTATLTLNSGNIIAAIVVGVVTSHVAFWLMFNLNVARFIVPFSVTISSLSVHHTLMAGNEYTFAPSSTWTIMTWTPSSYAIIVSAITAAMCFLFTGIQFSRMQLSRNALHIILNKAKSQISILEGSLSSAQKHVTVLEKSNGDYSRMLELIAYCGPTYTDHSLALSFAKEKPILKGVNKEGAGNTTGGSGNNSPAGTPTAAGAAAALALNGSPIAANGQVVDKGQTLLPSFQPSIHSDTSFLLTLDKVEEATKDPASVLAKLEGDLELRDIVKNAVTLEIFKHFMMSEHAAESLGLYLDIQRYKMIATKEARAAMGQRMYKEYLEDKSPQEVNVGQATRVQVMKHVTQKNWSHSMFEPVEKALYSLMSMDTLVRFRKTKDYVICALLLSTFGSLDRAIVDMPIAPSLGNYDDVSVVRGTTLRSGADRETSTIGIVSQGSRYTEVGTNELTPLSQPRHLGSIDLGAGAVSSPKGIPRSITGSPQPLVVRSNTGSLLLNNPTNGTSSPVNAIAAAERESRLATGSSLSVTTTSAVGSPARLAPSSRQELLPGELSST
jgi:hypothetical protein